MRVSFLGSMGVPGLETVWKVTFNERAPEFLAALSTYGFSAIKRGDTVHPNPGHGLGK